MGKVINNLNPLYFTHLLFEIIQKSHALKISLHDTFMWNFLFELYLYDHGISFISVIYESLHNFKRIHEFNKAKYLPFSCTQNQFLLAVGSEVVIYTHYHTLAPHQSHSHG